MISRVECMAQRGRPRSIVGMDVVADMIGPTVLPPPILERFADFCNLSLYLAAILERMALEVASVAYFIDALNLRMTPCPRKAEFCGSYLSAKLGLKPCETSAERMIDPVFIRKKSSRDCPNPSVI